MLVLARKEGEVLLIGDSIQITIVEVKGRSVRLGIKAPREILVDRPERQERRAERERELNRAG